MGAIAVNKKFTSKKRIKNINDFILIAVLGIFSLTMIIPFWWMISTAFDEAAMFEMVIPPVFWPTEFTTRAFYVAFNNVPMMRYMFNTFIVAGGNITIAILSAVMAGYALSKIRFKGATFVLMLALSTMMIPAPTMMVPRFFLFHRFGLVDSYLAFWLPAAAYAFGTFFTKQYMDSIPDSLRESARIDGAGELRIALQIYMPLCGAMIATMVILLFLGTWNDFMWPMIILTSPSRYTVQLGIAMFSMNMGGAQSAAMPAVRLAITTVSIIPVLIMYLCLQRFIVESIALSGVKQ